METAHYCISIYSNDNRINLYYNGTEVVAEAWLTLATAIAMNSNPTTITLWHKKNDKWTEINQFDLPAEE
jgi:hypothetical protein